MMNVKFSDPIVQILRLAYRRGQELKEKAQIAGETGGNKKTPFTQSDRGKEVYYDI